MRVHEAAGRCQLHRLLILAPQALLVAFYSFDLLLKLSDLGTRLERPLLSYPLLHPIVLQRLQLALDLRQ